MWQGDERSPAKPENCVLASKISSCTISSLILRIYRRHLAPGTGNMNMPCRFLSPRSAVAVAVALALAALALGSQAVASRQAGAEEEQQQLVPNFWRSCTFNFSGGARLPYPFCNASVPIDARVRDLLGRMTYQEKSAALDTSNPAVWRLGVPSMKGGESTHGVATGCKRRPDMNGSTGCPTSFPSGPTLGATFDRPLWQAIGGIIGREARGLNNQAIPRNKPAAPGVGDVPSLPSGPSGVYFLDPNINLMRDPR